MMRAGAMRKRLKVQSLSESQSATGVVSRSWVTDATRWVHKKQLTAQEARANGSTEASETYEMTMRYYAGLTPDQRLWDGIPDSYYNFDGTFYATHPSPSTEDPFYRATNGDGNAWSIYVRYRSSGSGTLLYYGDYNGGAVKLAYNGSTVTLDYGELASNNLGLSVTTKSDRWTQLLVTFDGGATGGSDPDKTTYSDAFSFYVDGAEATPSVTIAPVVPDWGYEGSIPATYYYVGASAGAMAYDKLTGTKVSQIAVWNSVVSNDDVYERRPFDQSSNSPTSYFSMSTFNATNLVADVGTKMTWAGTVTKQDWRPDSGIYHVRSVDNLSLRNKETRLVCTREV